MSEPWFRSRSGVPIEVLAVLLIVMGVLVIVFPHMIAWLLGLTLIGIGVLWLMSSWGSRRSYAEPPRTYGPPPARPPYP